MSGLVSVVVPTYREAANLPLLVPRLADAMARAGLAWECVVVDDDSRDGTEAACATLATTFPVRLVVRRGERGLATAVLAGFREARGDPFVVMDADLSHPPEVVPALVAAVREGRGDLVFGSRAVEGASTDERWGLVRRLNSWVATWLARPLTSAADPMSGFFALSRATLATAAPLDPVGYKIGLELSVKCVGSRVVEVPIHFADRAHGESKLGVRERLRYLRHLLRLYAFRLSRRARAAGRQPPVAPPSA